jgi:excisionase family DNA binding protein
VPSRPEEVLTMPEFCDQLRIGYPTALRMIQRGVIKGAFKVGAGKSSRRKRWRIPASEVERIRRESIT